MIETLQNVFTVFGRVITILPLLLFVTLFMGKRAIGQLPVFDFIIILTLGSVTGADIADPNINHLPTAAAIIMIGILQRLVAKWKISNRKFGGWITFEPTVVIQDGKILNHNLKKVQYSIDNILLMLREKDVFDISEIKTAVVEANGALSVLKKPQKTTVTREDLNIANNTVSIAYPVIVDGQIYPNVLEKLLLDEAWLRQQLKNQGITHIEDIFFGSINEQHFLQISLKNESNIHVPPIHYRQS
ncbi:DUF421 domain-containing protein [Gracilibacillus sp. YIM 98692]|uniref:DUF421 domain-containing protein n=1 Tax=Gracilibacillus sp. YIM 98692 TaxID=2663532 RepID=UPI0013CF4CC5|nr:DUF421 domain-containing protein [Gracilibacillus sp. YIM 98692]